LARNGITGQSVMEFIGTNWQHGSIDDGVHWHELAARVNRRWSSLARIEF